MAALDDLAAMRAPAGPQPQGQPQGPMAPAEGEAPVTASEPQFGDSRAQGVAKAPVPSSQLVQFGPIKLDPRIIPAVQGLLKAVPGLTPVDGHRTEKQQKRANPQETESFHMDGTAVDFTGKAGDLQKGFQYAKMNGAHEVILHNVGGGYHLHMAFDPQELEAEQQAQQQPAQGPAPQGPPPGGPAEGGIVPPEQQAAEGPIPG